MDTGSNDLFVSTSDLNTGVYKGIGVQTEEMIRLWKKLTPENVIVDTTACVSRYKHVAYSVVSVDKENRGHVVAWLIVEKEERNAIADLLHVIRMRCGETKPRVFMSDDSSALINSWYV